MENYLTKKQRATLRQDYIADKVMVTADEVWLLKDYNDDGNIVYRYGYLGTVTEVKNHELSDSIKV